MKRRTLLQSVRYYLWLLYTPIKWKMLQWCYSRRIVHWYLVKTDKIGQHGWGNWICVNSHNVDVTRWIEKAKETELKKAKEFMPQKYWKDIKIIVKTPRENASPFDSIVTVGWKYTP